MTARAEQITALAAALREAARLLEARAENAVEAPSGPLTELDPEKVLDFLRFFGSRT